MGKSTGVTPFGEIQGGASCNTRTTLNTSGGVSLKKDIGGGKN